MSVGLLGAESHRPLRESQIAIVHGDLAFFISESSLLQACLSIDVIGAE